MLVRPDFVSNRLEHREGELLGLLDSRAGRCAHPELEPARVNLREDLQAEASTNADDDEAGKGEIGRHDQPSPAHDARHGVAVLATETARTNGPGLARLVAVTKQPRREHRARTCSRAGTTKPWRIRPPARAARRVPVPHPA